MATSLNEMRGSYVRKTIPSCCVLALISLAGRGGSSGPQTNPAPTIATINPTSATRGGPSFTLTVNGSNLISNSTVQWNGKSHTTNFVSGTQLTAQISSDDISVADAPDAGEHALDRFSPLAERKTISKEASRPKVMTSPFTSK